MGVRLLWRSFTPSIWLSQWRGGGVCDGFSILISKIGKFGEKLGRGYRIDKHRTPRVELAAKRKKRYFGGKLGDNMPDDKISFGMKVRLARLLLRFRQDTFAKALGVSPVTMSRWEHGTQVPHRTTQRMFLILAERHGILFDEQGYPIREADISVD